MYSIINKFLKGHEGGYDFSFKVSFYFYSIYTFFYQYSHHFDYDMSHSHHSQHASAWLSILHFYFFRIEAYFIHYY
jgi:hypothetical protein